MARLGCALTHARVRRRCSLLADGRAGDGLHRNGSTGVRPAPLDHGCVSPCRPNQYPTERNIPGAKVSEASISEVSPVFVSTSAWLAFANTSVRKSRPGASDERRQALHGQLRAERDGRGRRTARAPARATPGSKATGRRRSARPASTRALISSSVNPDGRSPSPVRFWNRSTSTAVTAGAE